MFVSYETNVISSCPDLHLLFPEFLPLFPPPLDTLLTPYSIRPNPLLSFVFLLELHPQPFSQPSFLPIDAQRPPSASAGRAVRGRGLRNLPRRVLQL